MSEKWISGRELVSILCQSPMNVESEMFGVRFRRLNRDAFSVIGEGGSVTANELASHLASVQPIPDPPNPPRFHEVEAGSVEFTMERN